MTPREQAARRICARLREAGYRALFAGGCVRDRLLGLTPQDFDIATSAPPTEVARLFHKHFTVGAAFGTILVVEHEGHFEVTTFRADGPYEDGRHPTHVTFGDEHDDAARRDFTINAMFFDPETDTILDYAGGQADMAQRILRTVGDPKARFAEDYLRMLRAVRFAARLDYTIDPDTLAAIQALREGIHRISAERIRDELVKMLTEGHAKRAFELLDTTGLLAEILPEVNAMKGVEQPPEYHPEGDVFVHTLLLLEHLDTLPQRTPTLAMAALLHDVGKPVTQTFEDRIRFNHHDRIGAQMTQAICQRLRFSNEQTERIVWLVDQHMRYGVLPDMRESKRKRFVRTPGFEELAQLHRLDCRASHADESIADTVDAYIAALPADAIHPTPLLTGTDLIALGYPPGPAFKEILHTLEDAQLEGALTTPEAARAFVQKTWPPGNANHQTGDV
jgi:poly(A) polymerase